MSVGEYAWPTEGHRGATDVPAPLGGGEGPREAPRGKGAAQRMQTEGTVPGFALVTMREGVGS